MEKRAKDISKDLYLLKTREESSLKEATKVQQIQIHLRGNNNDLLVLYFSRPYMLMYQVLVVRS